MFCCSSISVWKEVFVRLQQSTPLQLCASDKSIQSSTGVMLKTTMPGTSQKEMPKLCSWCFTAGRSLVSLMLCRPLPTIASTIQVPVRARCTLFYTKAFLSSIHAQSHNCKQRCQPTSHDAATTEAACHKAGAFSRSKPQELTLELG